MTLLKMLVTCEYEVDNKFSVTVSTNLLLILLQNLKTLNQWLLNYLNYLLYFISYKFLK
jgi:hypothetical protein